MKTLPLSYEYERVADVKRLRFIASSLDELPAQSRVLDVGCGNGVISRYLGQLGYEVLGIDVSDKTIAKASALNQLPNVRFETISAEALTAKGHRYDAVICSEVLEHLDHPEALLHTLYASLKDEGILVVTVPNGQGPREMCVTRPMLKARSNKVLWPVICQTKRLLGFRGTTVQSAADNLDHVQFFTRRDLLQLAHRSQFRIVRFAKSNFVEDVFPFSLLTKRVRFLQTLDCRIADVLPLSFTGGFHTIWKKKGSWGPK